MRSVREITADEEGFRIEPMGGLNVIRRDPVQPEPIGTFILIPHRVVGYDRDCDGSLMARLEQVGLDELDSEIDPEILAASLSEVQKFYGISTHRGLYPTTGLVATPDEIRALFATVAQHGADER